MSVNGYIVDKMVEKAAKRQISYEEYAAYVEQHQKTKNARHKAERNRLKEQDEKRHAK